MKDQDAELATKLLHVSTTTVDSFIELAREIKFDKEDPQHLSSICLYATILEIAGSMNVLVESKQTTSVPILLRSLLEALASFRCCCTDPNHARVMGANFLEQKRRLLRSAMDYPDNPYLKGLAGTPDLKADFAGIEKEIGNLAMNGAKALNKFEEFQKAGLLAEYHSLYWILCMQAHNNVSALEDRHLEKDGANYEVAMYKDENPADTIRNLDSMCGLVIDASYKVHGLLETGLNARVADIANGLADIRGRYGEKTAEPGKVASGAQSK